MRGRTRVYGGVCTPERGGLSPDVCAPLRSGVPGGVEGPTPAKMAISPLEKGPRRVVVLLAIPCIAFPQWYPIAIDITV